MPDDGAMADIRKSTLTAQQQESVRRQIEGEEAHARAVEKRDEPKDQGMRTNMRNPAPAPPAAAPAPRTKRMTLGAATTGIVQTPRRIFIYGDGGLGKSTFAAEAGGTIFVDTQGGTANIPSAHRFPQQPNTWEDVLDAVDEVINETHSYKNLALDLIDDVERMLWAYICKRDGYDNVEGYGFQKHSKIALVEWRVLVSKLERVRREKKMGIFISGHSGVCKFKNPEAEDYGQFGPQIDPAASGFLRGWCDTVLYAYLETFAKTDTKTRRTRGISTGTRLLRTVGTAAYYAKNRDNLPDPLPLDWAEYASAVEAGTPATSEALLDEIRRLTAQLDESTRKVAEETTAQAMNDANKLVRILNRLREKVPTVQQSESEGAQ